MDATVVSAIIGAGGAIMGAAAGYLGAKSATELNLKMWQIEYKEKYQEITFEKRLEVHQEAFCLIQNLYAILHIVSIMENQENAKKQLSEITKNARDWWNKKALYLDEVSRRLMIPTINMCAIFLRLKDSGNANNIYNQLENTENAILEGIGNRYLPNETKISRNELIKTLDL